MSLSYLPGTASLLEELDKDVLARVAPAANREDSVDRRSAGTNDMF